MFSLNCCSLAKKCISILVLVTFNLGSVLPSPVLAQVLLPEPGTMVALSAPYMPVSLQGLTVHADNPLLFDFLVNTGNTTSDTAAIKEESQKLIKYFLASLAISEKNQWVNLSPYEKNRILPEELGKTELGRDMLAQDYMLKQVTASLIYPEKDLGKAFWKRVYARAKAEFGTDEIPMDTFNKVWITADHAAIYTHKDPNVAGRMTAVVTQAHLKVMMESDYLAMQNAVAAPSMDVTASDPRANIAKEVVREIVLPELEKEVNTGKNFSNLRQIHQAVILATWYKRNLKDALLTQVYADQAHTNGVEGAWVVNSQADVNPEAIWTKYVDAFKKGVFSLIKDDVNQTTGEVTAHKYFSGGAHVVPAAIDEGKSDDAMKVLSYGGRIFEVTTIAKASEAIGQLNSLDGVLWADLVGGKLGEMIERDQYISITTNPALIKAYLTSLLSTPEGKALVNSWVDLKKTMNKDVLVGDLFSAVVKNLAERVIALLKEKAPGKPAYFSVELDPRMSHNIEASIAEARKWTAMIDPRHLMTKVLATEEGTQSNGIIQTLLEMGIQVNVTGIFYLDQYEKVAQAYIRAGAKVPSFASFFVSRWVKPMGTKIAGLVKAGKIKTVNDLQAAIIKYGEFPNALIKVAYSDIFLKHFGHKLPANPTADMTFENLDQNGVQYFLVASNSNKTGDYLAAIAKGLEGVAGAEELLKFLKDE
ncbi:MAG: hypothetical protein HQL19_05760, partial [Candidatus Omnitrophica bacterium]|nr:hypothetical protein [Candidatus Omnitrophota bacterium]